MDEQVLSYVLDFPPVCDISSKIQLSVLIVLLQIAQHTLFWGSLVDFDYAYPQQQIRLLSIHFCFTALTTGQAVVFQLPLLLQKCSIYLLLLAPAILLLLCQLILHRTRTLCGALIFFALTRQIAIIFYKQANLLVVYLLISPRLKQRYIFIMNSFASVFALLVLGLRCFFKVIPKKCHFTFCDYSESMTAGVISAAGLVIAKLVYQQDGDRWRMLALHYRKEPHATHCGIQLSHVLWGFSTCVNGIVHGYNFSCIEFSFLINYFERYRQNIYPFTFWFLGTGVCQFCISLFYSSNASLRFYVVQIILMNAVLSSLQVFQNIPNYISYSILFRGAIMQYTQQEYYYVNQKCWPPKQQYSHYIIGTAVIYVVSAATFYLAWIYYYRQLLMEKAQQIYNANFLEMILSGGLLVVEIMVLAVSSVICGRKRVLRSGCRTCSGQYLTE